MEESQILEKLQAIARRYTNEEEIVITGETVFLTDLGLNSYELVHMVCVVEEEFGIEIPDRAISRFKTVRNLMDFIAAQG